MNKKALKAQLKGICVNTDLTLIFAFIFLLWSIRGFFLPFRPHMLTDINFQRNTMILPTMVVCCLALLHWNLVRDSEDRESACQLCFRNPKKMELIKEQSLRQYLCLLFGSFHARLTGVSVFHHLVHWQKEKGAAALLGTTLQTALLQNKQTMYF